MNEQDRPKETAPPFPAPYLANVPQLPDELLEAMDGRRPRGMTPKKVRESDRRLRTLKERLFYERRSYEAEKSIHILPEPPLAP